jgi:hypothetical protein
MPPPPSAAAAGQPPSLASRAGMLVRDVRDLALDHLELAALEAQRAVYGLTKMLTAAVVISILVVSAWLALVSGGIVWATANGVSWPVALLIAAVVNLALAGALAFWIKGQAVDLMFSATLRQLRRTADDHAEVTP